jgi:Domain found in Dishevelled, Egl-10, and Pleckstrin (DEP)
MSTDKPHRDPALVSGVALAFKATIVPGVHYQVDVVYNDVFTGREAIDTLCTLLQTSDRKLAIAVGRDLEEQGLFHDVNHVHRLRDDGNKLYCFTREPSVDDAQSTLGEGNTKLDAPSGLYTLLTRCYSPTCGLKGEPEVCYSSFCPTFPRSTEAEETEGGGGNASEGGEYCGDSWPDEEDNWGESFVARDSVRGSCYSPVCTVGGYCYSPTCIKVSSAPATLRLAEVAHRSGDPLPEVYIMLGVDNNGFAYT